MAHHRQTRRSKKFFQKFTVFLHWVYWTMAIVSVLVSAGVVGYFSGYNDGLDDCSYTLQVERKRANNLQEQLRQMTVKTARHEYDDQPATIKKPPEGPKRVVKRTVEKPKLAIIIDDVSFARDVQHIKKLGIPLTMSFLPPNIRHPNSALLAAKEPFYMVHLPLEARSFKNEEPLTLYVNDSKEKIAQRVKQIKELFPNVKYINNHTGSKFTASEDAMNRLIYALNNQNINFIDSRTTSKTTVPKVMKNFGKPYVARDVFLDHNPEVASVKKQIKEAIRLANKHGSAIAIGHPHKRTLQALRESKKLFDSVELVQINSYY